MKCDLCDSEAIVHEVVLKGGKLVEKHLCENHAQEAGFEVAHQQVPVHDLFKLALSAASGTTRQVISCPRCGMTLAEFQKSGLLGCHACYETFESRLGPLLERAHEGALHHVGKLPQRALRTERSKSQGAGPPPLSVTDRARLLRARLQQAVKKEDYEQAARLRDELADLQTADEDRNDA